jgi:hypothetical protein
MPNAVLGKNWFKELPAAARVRAGRIALLILRLVHGETADPELFHAFQEFLNALPNLSETEQDAAECLAALRIVRTLGLDAGDVPSGFTSESLSQISNDRTAIILRINHGLAASGL